jgi:hypothetical protein
LHMAAPLSPCDVGGQLSSKAELPFMALTLAKFACMHREKKVAAVCGGKECYSSGRRSDSWPTRSSFHSGPLHMEKQRTTKVVCNEHPTSNQCPQVHLYLYDRRACICDEASRHEDANVLLTTAQCLTLRLMSFLAQLTFRFLWGKIIILSTTWRCLTKDMSMHVT